MKWLKGPGALQPIRKLDELVLSMRHSCVTHLCRIFLKDLF
jgi:hypothetical protein